MTQRIWAIAFGCLVLAGFLGLALGEHAHAGDRSVDPIRIEGNAQLRAWADQGEGTPLSPYMIQGLDIDVQSASHCLVLRNIDAHFIVRDCAFTGAFDAAILLENSRGGWILECSIEGNGCGLECREGTRNVVLSGNTFRNNGFDVVGSVSSVDWDDGYLGNFWDRYDGCDENQDGIGDTPYSLSSPSSLGTTAVDRYPLLEPLGGDASAGVLLHVSYHIGDSFDVLQTAKSAFALQFLFPLSSETETKIRARQRVLAAPGTGLFTIEETIVQDDGRTTINGFPEAYESSAGVVAIRRVHRLGAMPDPGYGAVSAEVAGITMPAQLPARRVQPGDTWGASWGVDAGALDIDEGEQRFEATFAFTRFEQLDGDLCAVIDGRADMTLEGRSFDPDLGLWIHLAGEGAIETTLFFSLGKQRVVKQSETVDLSIMASAFGMRLFTQSIQSEITALEVPIDGEPPVGATSCGDLDSANEALARGIALLSAGDAVGAERVLLYAADLFATLGESEREGNALFGVAMAMMSQEKVEKAIPVLERAAACAHAVFAVHDEAACYNSLGLCYRRLGEHQAALECYDRVLDLCEDDLDTQSTALLNTGVCLASLGDYMQAIEKLEAAGQLKDRILDLDGKIRVLINLGPCYRKLGLFVEALATYDEAVSSCTSPAQDVFKATALQNRGACHMEMGSFSEAMQDLEASRSLWQAVGDPCGAAAAWITTASCQRAMGDPVAAWSSLDHAAALCTRSDIRGSIDSVRAWCRMDFGDQATAIDLFHQALSWANAGADLESTWRCKHGLGSAHWACSQLFDAESWYGQAISDVEEARSLVASEATRTAFFETVRELYEEYLELLLQMERPEETLPVAERMRARTFLDLVAIGPIRTLENVVEEGIRTGVVEASAIEADLAEVIAALPGDTAALEYFVTEDATYAWLVRDGSVSDPVRIEVGRDGLREEVLAYRRALETPATGLMDLPDEATLTRARDLYDLLIAPVESQLDGIEHLVIVPSGPLYYLPFAALLDCQDCTGPELWGGTYLVERYSVSYVPSLTTLKYAWASANRAHGDPLFLALADPDSGDAGIPRLPEAQREAERAAELFDPSEVYADTEATEVLLRARAGSADQVLLSTHGVFNPRNAMFSYLLFSPSEGSDGRLYTHEIFGLDLQSDLVVLSACETLLPALEEAREQVRAVRAMGEEEEVELTEEMLEALTAGDEIVGLTRAFLAAGAPSVLSSLWRVVSETTEPLMVAFYGYLNGGMNKAEALRQAQLDVMASYPHPRHWAAFELVGDWR